MGAECGQSFGGRLFGTTFRSDKFLLQLKQRKTMKKQRNAPIERDTGAIGAIPNFNYFSRERKRNPMGNMKTRTRGKKNPEDNKDDKDSVVKSEVKPENETANKRTRAQKRKTHPTDGDESEKSNKRKSYEEIRLENIRRNQEMLASLELEGFSLPTQKKNKIIKKSSKPNVGRRLPSRRSKRVQGLDADGKKLPDNWKALPKSGYKPTKVEEEANMEVSASNKEFLETLKSNTKVKSEDKPEMHVSTIKYAERLSSLEVNSAGVEKITKERIYSLAVHPSTSNIIVAAGDKAGNLGLWKLGTNGTEGMNSSFHPHRNVIAGVLFDKVDPNRLYTSGYDGGIRMLDLNKQKFSEVITETEDSFYEMDAEKGSKAILVSSLCGYVRRLDTRAKSFVDTWELHQNKIFTVRHNPTNPFELCTASLDRTMRIWDTRKIKKKPVYEMVHGLCVTAASFSPDGKYLVSCCNDNLLRIWTTADLKSGPKDEDGPSPSSQIRHDNRTGRWLTKFKPEWDPKQANAFVSGSMSRPRCIEVFGVNNKGKGSMIMRLCDDYVGSVQSLNVFHPSLDIIVSANSSGRCHAWRHGKSMEAA
mmetsp:Transcript_19703/g.29423  ORF Transcript_19703/g.29423 Transcript_19703/m.29423 type:complete len:589 (-) Transcript_19703:262-2028(-)